MTTATLPPAPRFNLVNEQTAMKPHTLARLADWQYLERTTHRLLVAWTGFEEDWGDKSHLHRHIWEQAEIVRRLRERIGQFPAGRVDDPVSARLETLGNALLLAPSLTDAVDGIYQLLNVALVRSYSEYVRGAHPVHDAPTIQMLSEIVALKEQHRLWWRDYRRRHPGATAPGYRAAVESELAACGQLLDAIPVGATVAQPIGVNTQFRLRVMGARPAAFRPRRELRPYIDLDFTTSVEARRLFWAYGYMLEKNLPDIQLRWLFDSHFMPWEFHYDVSRHLWDESRHGDSGRSRFLDFGITIEEVGYQPYGEWTDALGEPFTPAQLYAEVYQIGLIAETGHFKVKQEAYQDFRDGGDFESAEMMLFDIIDESTHVQYAHRWLPVLAEHTRVDNAGYRERADRERARRQTEYLARVAASRQTLRTDTGNPDWVAYQQLLSRMRQQKPLTNAGTCPPRSPLPM
jgi:hypothetical protein